MLENALDYEGLKYYDGKSKEYIEGYVDGIASNIQTQLDKKAPLTNPTLTGTPKAPTAASGTNTTQIATTAFVQTAVKEGLAELVDEAPETMDTLKEVSDAIAEHQEVTDALNAAIGNKVDKVAGKGLSTNDFTNEEKEKLENVVTLNDSQALTNKTYNGYTLADACAREVKNLTAKGNLELVSLTDDGLHLPTVATLAWWDGRWKDGLSNLTYCTKGAFGNASVKDVDTIPTKNSSNLITSGSVYSELDKKLSKSESASSATTIYNTVTNPTDPTNYYIPFFTGTASENKSLLFNGGLSYKCQDGTEDVDGAGILVLGNGVSSGTAGNKYGAVLMWGKDPYFSQITPGALTASRHVTLPDASGTMVLTTAEQALTNKTYNGYTLGDACNRGVTNLTAKGSLGLVSLTDDGLKLPTIGTLAWWDGTFNTNGNKSNLSYCIKGAFGDACVKGILNNTTLSDLAFNKNTAQTLVPTVSSIAYWNGAYLGTSSNLLYCKKGAFGDAVTKGVDTSLVSNSTNLITSGAVYSHITSAINEVNSDINVERTRIDSIVALQDGSTTGDAELQDIRIGMGGSTYKTAGGAVRGQFDTITSCLKSLGTYIYHPTFENCYIKASDGSLVSNTEYSTTELILVPAKTKITFKAFGSSGAALYATYTYDGESEVLSQIIKVGYGISESNLATYEYYAYKDTYLRICFRDDTSYLSTNDYYVTFSAITDKYRTPSNLQHANGYISSSTNEVVKSGTAYQYTTNIELFEGETIEFIGTGTDVWALAEYTSNYVFVQGLIQGNDRYNRHTYTADKHMYVRLCARCSITTDGLAYVPTDDFINSIKIYFKDNYYKDVVNDVLYGKKITLIGDSLAFGNRIGNGAVWLRELALKYNMIETNLGINSSSVASYSGATVTPMVERYDEIPDSDYIVLIGGANDWNNAVPIGTISDTSTTTFCGALNTIIDGIRLQHPKAKLLFLTNYARYGTAKNGIYEVNYVEAMKDVCANKCVACFDNYHNSGIYFLDNNLNWMDEGFIFNNGTKNKHLSVEAYQYLAPKYEALIKGL